MVTTERRIGQLAGPDVSGVTAIACLSNEASEAILNRSLTIFSLSGLPINTLLEKMRGKYPNLDIVKLGLESEYADLSSRQSQVAIDLKRIMLRGTEGKTFAEQVTIADEYGRKIKKEIPGIKVVVANLPDLLEIDLINFDLTKEHLFKRKGFLGNRYFDVRTDTKGSKDSNLEIPKTNFDLGMSENCPDKLFISKIRPDAVGRNLGVAVLLVPSQNESTGETLKIEAPGIWPTTERIQEMKQRQNPIEVYRSIKSNFNPWSRSRKN